MTAQVKELQKEIRSINEANGWYEDERPFSADIALLHSEVDELEEALVLGGEYDNSTEEMADILIRLLDTAERRNYDIELAVQEEIVLDEPTIEADSPDEFPSALHRLISRAYEGYRKHDNRKTELYVSLTYVMLLKAAKTMNKDIDSAVRIKMEKNRKRGYRYGGKAE